MPQPFEDYRVNYITLGHRRGYGRCRPARNRKDWVDLAAWFADHPNAPIFVDIPDGR